MKFPIIFSFLFLSTYSYSLEKPFYEFCASSQINLKNGAAGGSGGHGFVYVHGLCKDYSKDFPQVIPCSEAIFPEGLEHQGVGISLDSGYRNAKWIAVPGRDLFLFGDKKQNSSNLKEENIVHVLNQSVDKKIFEGINYYNEKSSLPKEGFAEVLGNSGVEEYSLYSNPFNIDRTGKQNIDLSNLTYDTPEYQKFVALLSVGTDIAINFGRDMACVQLPVNRKNLQAVAQFLNEENQLYQDGVDYVWSGILNNCTHISSNVAYHFGLITKFVDVEPEVLPGKMEAWNYFKNIFTKRETDVVTPSDFFLKLQNIKGSSSKFYAANSLVGENNFFVTKDLKVVSVEKLGKVSIKSLVK